VVDNRNLRIYGIIDEAGAREIGVRTYKKFKVSPTCSYEVPTRVRWVNQSGILAESPAKWKCVRRSGCAACQCSNLSVSTETYDQTYADNMTFTSLLAMHT
jgi:hypothetical protein